MWGTTSFCDELTGDFGGAFDATSIDGRRLFCRLAEIWSHGVLELLQQIPLKADSSRTSRHVRNVPILLQKSKIERPRKSRESGFLDVSSAANLYRADRKDRGRFCVKRCGPSHRRAQSASAALINFVRQPKKTFSTLSANRRHGAIGLITRRYLGPPRA
jgi:hypothetical protein